MYWVDPSKSEEFLNKFNFASIIIKKRPSDENTFRFLFSPFTKKKEFKYYSSRCLHDSAAKTTPPVCTCFALCLATCARFVLHTRGNCNDDPRTYTNSNYVLVNARSLTSSHSCRIFAIQQQKTGGTKIQSLKET